MILEEDDRAPRFEEFEKFQCSDPTLHGGVAAVGQRLEEISRQSGVLVENKNYLVTVKPTKPLAGVNGAEGAPKLKQSSVAPARGEGGGERGGGREGERKREREADIFNSILALRFNIKEGTHIPPVPITVKLTQ